MSPRCLAIGCAMIIALLPPATGCIAEVGPEEEEAEGVNPDDPLPWSATPEGTDTEEELDRWISSGCKMVSGFANGDHTQLTYLSVAKLARSAGVGCGYNLVKAVAVAAAESGRYQHRYLKNRNCTTDRGIWQINSIHGGHSSFSLATNAHGMAVISSYGRNWSPWVAYKKGLWKTYHGSACAAVKAACGKSYC